LKAAQLDPGEKSTRYQLAQLYERLTQPDESKAQMDIFRKLYIRRLRPPHIHPVASFR